MTNLRNRILLRGLSVLAMSLAFAGTPARAVAASAVNSLIGAWGGSGRISYTDGSSEAIRCTAYNRVAGDELRLAIQCRSEKNPIHIRSQLEISGSRASGRWEERTFNASGTASGRIGSSSLSLSISGGGFDGSMSVAVSRSSLRIDIRTTGIAMNRATMRLSRQD